MPSTSPMPPKNLAAVRISDRSTETQTQTGYSPSIGSGGLTPRSPVLELGSSYCVRREVRAFLQATGRS